MKQKRFEAQLAEQNIQTDVHINTLRQHEKQRGKIRKNKNHSQEEVAARNKQIETLETQKREEIRTTINQSREQVRSTRSTK